MNTCLEDAPRTETEFKVYIDSKNPVAEIRIGEERTVLKVGEWSDWVQVRFELAQLISVVGMSRFYLKELSPHFRLYASPVNIDPGEPAQEISTPDDYSKELAEAAGPFYTQELPEETKALSAHVLTPSEFLDQSGLVMDERRRLLKYELARFRKQEKREFL